MLPRSVVLVSSRCRGWSPRSALLLALLGWGAIPVAAPAQTSEPKFVPIPGGDFLPAGARAGATVALRPFELMDRPMTNAQWAAFCRATGHPAPAHWTGGKVPAGREDHPVIFVNRPDVQAYCRWAERGDGRIHRLPTTMEFEWAARGGGERAAHAWGGGAPDAAQINFDAAGDRRFDQWERHLQPADWGWRNGYGLWGMAGNVWQLVVENPDPATTRFKYRIEEPSDLERAVIGGSWARGSEYLGAGQVLAQSPGMRHPDLGFRLVREPAGAPGRTEARRVSAVPAGGGGVLVGWACLAEDRAGTRYHVYRLSGDRRQHLGRRLTAEPVRGATCWLDRDGLVAGTRYQYRVEVLAPEATAGGGFSDWAGVQYVEGGYPTVAEFRPLAAGGGGLVPVFGDLEGGGRPGCVIRLDNGNVEMSQDPGVPVQLEAFSCTGRPLWRRDVARHDHLYGSASNAPFNVWDLDGDGRAEVITLLQIGDVNHVAVLDGLSGRVRASTPWPEMLTDFAKSSTRVQMSIAYLDGRRPAVVTQTGLYENEVVAAFDADLKPLWTYRSTGATSGSGGHKIEIADVDGDGRQEVVYGTTCLNADGTARWSIHRQHPDIISIHDYLPERPGLEVFFIVETSIHAGVYLVDANSGAVIWKNNRADDPRWSHGHSGWTADIWAGSPGIECISNRAGHNDSNYVLFSAAGRKLLEPFPAGWTPFEWDGDATRELLGDRGRTAGKFDGRQVVVLPGENPNPIPESSVIFVADLAGDFRDELVLLTTGKDGRKSVVVVTAPTPVARRLRAPWTDRDYRLWLARNKGGGYASVYDPGYAEPR